MQRPSRPPPEEQPGVVAAGWRLEPRPSSRRNAYRQGKRTATVVLEPELHDRLVRLAKSSGKTIQMHLVEGAEMVAATYTA